MLLQHWLGKMAFVVAIGTSMAAAAAQQEPFGDWLAALRSEAQSQGIGAEVLEQVLGDVKLLPRVIELDHKQPEFTMTYRTYMSRVVSRARVAKGRSLITKHRRLLNEVSKKYGVPVSYIVALWGIETDFGRLTGGFSVVPALVTLAYDGRRSRYFRKELLDALTILNRGDIGVHQMTGSWAGAMGQNQFMPSSFLRFAEDHNGDGRRDIWHTEADIFASTANYLAKSGWVAGRSWGTAVALPKKGIDTALANLDIRKDFAEWSRLGLQKANGQPLPKTTASAALVLINGLHGPAFLVSENFDVIRKWNKSNLFALAVGHLADRLSRK